MSDRVVCRPGGRSARIQASVHQAVLDLLREVARADLTVPMIAARAGVTPSTLYRRWGDLTTILADVAEHRLRPDQMPAGSGDWRADLQAWTEQYADEMSSLLGRQMLRDIVSASVESGIATSCRAYVTQQIQSICDRGGEAAPEPEQVIELVVSPILYRILFDDRPADREFCVKLLGRVF